MKLSKIVDTLLDMEIDYVSFDDKLLINMIKILMKSEISYSLELAKDIKAIAKGYEKLYENEGITYFCNDETNHIVIFID